MIADNLPRSSWAVLVGENHLSHETRSAVADNLEALSRKGFNVVALELRPGSQTLLDDFSARRITTEQLEAALRPQESGFGEATLQAWIKVMATARENGMKLLAVDPPPSAEHSALIARMRQRSVTQDEVNARGADDIYRRSLLMGQAVEAELKSNSESKVLLLVGQNHLSMNGAGTIQYPNYQPVSYGLLGKGTDSYLQTQGIQTTSMVFVQKVNMPPEIVGARESSQVQRMIEISAGDPAVVRRRGDDRNGPELFVLLPAQK